jgi:hypothetical protein
VAGKAERQTKSRAKYKERCIKIWRGYLVSQWQKI